MFKLACLFALFIGASAKLKPTGSAAVSVGSVQVLGSELSFTLTRVATKPKGPGGAGAAPQLWAVGTCSFTSSFTSPAAAGAAAVFDPSGKLSGPFDCQFPVSDVAGTPGAPAAAAVPGTRHLRGLQTNPICTLVTITIPPGIVINVAGLVISIPSGLIVNIQGFAGLVGQLLCGLLGPTGILSNLLSGITNATTLLSTLGQIATALNNLLV